MTDTGYANADGLRVYFECAGSGQPLLLVHGWGSNLKHNWVETGWVDALVNHRLVISIDVRGHGKSDKPHSMSPYSYEALSQDVLAVMDELKIEQSEFMGYSMGAFMGAWLLGNHPERFTAMVLGGIGDETATTASQGRLIAKALRNQDEASPVRQFVEAIPGNDLEALACSAEQMWPEGYPLEVAGPGVSYADLPVLVVNGENDHPYVDSADRFVDALPDGRHVILPGEDHLTAVSSLQFRQTVIEFLCN